MRVLKQRMPIDIAGWPIDQEFAVFPQGARAKEAVFSPVTPDQDCLVSTKRYLFKRSRLSYPDQYWAEVVAYRVGCAFGVEVPPAFASWNSTTGTCGALIEWFYEDGEESCVLAGDFLTQDHSGFDRERGTTHNLKDNESLLRSLSQAGALSADGWRQWWVNALAFDALIGNTDRHQDNWAILFKTNQTEVPGQPIARLSPLFDNGTSLGHERFMDRVQGWDEGRINKFISKGTHKVKWSLDEPMIVGHFDLLKRALTEWPETSPSLSAMVARLSLDEIRASIEDLLYLDLPVPFSKQRYQFICKLLAARLLNLKQITQ